jgi:hypothetical protein
VRIFGVDLEREVDSVAAEINHQADPARREEFAARLLSLVKSAANSHASTEFLLRTMFLRFD